MKPSSNRDRVARILVTLAILVSGPAPAWGNEGTLPAPENSGTSPRSFTARLVVTDRPDDFLAAWSHPPSADYRPRIHVADRVKRGAKMTVAFLYGTCKANPDGNCDVDADLRVLAPNGDVVGKAPNLVVRKGKAPSEGVFYLGKNYLEISLDGSPGVHRIQALVRDNIAKARVPLEQTVEVVE